MPHENRINRQKNCRILMVSPMPPAMGGISVSTSRLRDNLIADGYDVDYYNVQPYSRCLPHKLHLLLNTLWLPFYILFNRRYDIIHFHVSGSARRRYVAMTKWMFKGARTVMTNHGDVERFIYERGMTGALKKMDRLICVRAGDVAKLDESLRERAIEIPAFILPKNIQEDALPEEIKEFLNEVKSRGLNLIVHNGLIVLDEYKDLYGFEDLANLFDALSAKNIAFAGLVVVNDLVMNAFQKQFLEKIKKRLESHKDVKVCTFTQFSLLPIFSRGGVIYVRPTKTDGDSLSVREALALGSKVVASDVAPRPKRAMVYPHVAGDQALCEAVINVFEEMKSTKSESSNISYGYYDEIVNVYDSLLNKDSN